MKNELLHGTLEVKILKTLSWRRMHGYGIGRWIMERGGDAITIEEGRSIQPCIAPRAQRVDRGRRGTVRKESQGEVLSLTTKGRRVLASNVATWSDFATAVSRGLSSADAPWRA
jgi:hypothetical protein